MLKRKITLPFLLLTLLLAGCDKISSSSETSNTPSDSATNSVSQTSTDSTTTESSENVVSSSETSVSQPGSSSGTPSSETPTIKVEIDGAALDELVGEAVYSLLPKIYSGEYSFYDDSSEDYPIDIYVDLWDWTEDDANNYYDALVSSLDVNEDGEFILTETLFVGIWELEDEEGAAFYSINIYSYAGETSGGGDGEGGLADMEQHTGWPTSAIAKYLSDYGVSTNVPSLTVSENTYTFLVEDDPNWDPYLFVVIPGADRIDEYVAVLEAANFDVEYDEDYDEYFAWDAAETVELEFYFDVAANEWPAGIYMFVSALEGSNSGEVIDPINPESAIVLDFSSEAQISGEKSGTLTTWAQSGATMAIAKGSSNEAVGNGKFFSDENGLLRIYSNQELTFTVPDGLTIDQIVFETAGAWASGRDSVAALLDGDYSPASTYTVGDDLAFVLSSPSSTFTVIPFAQLRVYSITIYLA